MPGGRDDIALDMSLDGRTIVGYWYNNSTPRGFYWREGQGMTNVGALGGAAPQSQLLGVSGDGVYAVGGSTIAGGGSNAARWSQANGWQSLGDLPGGVMDGLAFRANFDGSIIVGVSNSGNGGEAFRWTPSGMTGLGDLPGGIFGSSARDVTDDGSRVVGASQSGVNTLNHTEAFLWDATRGIRNLRTVLQTDYGLNLTGWVLEQASAISGDGRVIAGFGRNPAGNTEGWVVVIPALARCDSLDFNHDAVFPDSGDVADFLSVFGGGVCDGQPVGDPPCNSDIDFNNDGVFPDIADVEALLRVFAGGTC